MDTTVTQAPPVTQRQAAQTLTAIIGEGLPALTWTLYDCMPDRLDGQAAVGDDAKRTETVATYAALLGVGVVRDRSGGNTYTAISAAGVYRGVQVRVWAHIEKCTCEPGCQVHGAADGSEGAR